jgi:hypothetical protein
MPHQRRRLAIAVAVACLVGVSAVVSNGAGKAPAAGVAKAGALPRQCQNNPQCAGCTCPTAITSALATQPPVACPFEGESQGDMDIFAWNSFIAMNWPANTATCGPDTSKSIRSGRGPTVWETFAEDTSVFVQPPNSPAPWCGGARANLAALPPKVRQLAQRYPGVKALHYQSKAAALPFFVQPTGGVLTDQNGRWVRYELTLNQDEYKYLHDNQLWNQAGQLSFKQAGKTISFPTSPTGAMEFKASWKVLSQQEVASKRFYMTRAIVYNDSTGEPSPGPNPVTVGLVGLHITHKTLQQPTWYWATFEQVDNTTKSFYNPSCPVTTCPPNTQTAQQPYTELTPQGKPINKPVQVTRVNKIETTDPNVEPLNAYYRELLHGSVWEHYRLISLNWATGGRPDGTPARLANTTIETFIQPTSNCFGCHKGATTLPAAGGANADFSFLLDEAQAAAAAKK